MSDSGRPHDRECRLANDCRVIVYDDGNYMPTSVYEDDDVIEAVREKGLSTPRFRMRCYFNFDEDLKFRRAFDSDSRVEIRTGNGRRSSSAAEEVHCKIIDGGRLAHLSRHEVGAGERELEVVDCLAVPRWGFRHVARKEFGMHIRNFKRRFAKAANTSAIA